MTSSGSHASAVALTVMHVRMIANSLLVTVTNMFAVCDRFSETAAWHSTPPQSQMLVSSSGVRGSQGSFRAERSLRFPAVTYSSSLHLWSPNGLCLLNRVSDHRLTEGKGQALGVGASIGQRSYSQFFYGEPLASATTERRGEVKGSAGWRNVSGLGSTCRSCR